MRIIFFGTPPFAAQVLAFLQENNQEIVGVVTRPDRPSGRMQKMHPSAVKALVQEKWPEIPLFQPEKVSTDLVAQELKALEPDLFVVVAFGEIIKTNILEIPSRGCVNIHASLLPKYRGAAPIQRCLMNGDRESGVCIMEMVLKMDAGDVLERVKIPVHEEMTFGELEEKLCHLSGPALLRVIEKIKLGSIQKIPQGEIGVTFAPKITLEDRIIHWDRNRDDLHNLIRALSPYPGAFCFIQLGDQVKRLIIKRSQKYPALHRAPGETIVYTKNEWVVGCKEGALSLIEVQLEGKKTLSIQEFIRGIPPGIQPKIADTKSI